MIVVFYHNILPKKNVYMNIIRQGLVKNWGHLDNACVINVFDLIRPQKCDCNRDGGRRGVKVSHWDGQLWRLCAPFSLAHTLSCCFSLSLSLSLTRRDAPRLIVTSSESKQSTTRTTTRRVAHYRTLMARPGISFSSLR